ncbi:TPA: tyrosine-type recombinase/integrase [Mannheimia haemolytica]
MAVRKDEKRGKWLAELYLNGKRIRKWFDTKADASRFFNTAKQQNSPVARFILEEKEKKQSPFLSELVEQWYKLHGCTLQQGEKIYRKLLLMTDAMGNPRYSHFTAEIFANYREARLRGDIIFSDRRKTGSSEQTLNLEFRLLLSVFNKLIKLGKIENKINPLLGLSPFKAKEKEMRFLSKDEIALLLKACERYTPELLLAVKICLATGARWGEVISLKQSQLFNNRITFTNTKNGKNRTVPISAALFDTLPKNDGKIFTLSNSFLKQSFTRAVKRAGLVLRENQSTHVLRHTFASHFMMNGGNIIVLRDILGHYDIKMTMIYAHFAPAFLEQAVTLNPLEN